MLIDSGLGNGFKASVNNLNKLETRAITESLDNLHARAGSAFNIVTSVLNIDDADENGILYFQNNGNNSFIITSYGIMLGTSTGGSGVEWYFNSVRNPTGGTLTSAGTDITPRNFNAGSAKTLASASVVKEMAAANQTVTGGTDPWLATLGTGTGLQVVNVFPLILEPGNSIALTFEAQTGNTSQNVQAFILGYVNDQITTDVVKTS